MALEEIILADLEGSKEAARSCASKLTCEDSPAVEAFRSKLNDLVIYITGSVSPTRQQKEYLEHLKKSFSAPLCHAIEQLEIETSSGAIKHNYVNEFGKATILVGIIRTLWDKRTANNISDIDYRSEQLSGLGVFKDSLLQQPLEDAREYLHKEKDLQTLMNDFISGAKAGDRVVTYLSVVRSKLLQYPADWSPAPLAYFPSAKWRVHDIGKLKRTLRKKGVGWLVGGTISKWMLSVFMPITAPFLLNPLEYIVAPFIPGGMLSEEQEVELNGLRVGAELKKGFKRPVVVDCVYAGRVLSHPQFRDRTQKDLLARISLAERRKQFYVQCFVADLNDDKKGRFKKFIEGFKGGSNYAVYVYDYKNETLIYNKDDWKTQQFAGWFEPRSKFKSDSLKLRNLDVMHPTWREGDVPYIRIRDLQEKFPGHDASKLLKFVRGVHPRARIDGEDIMLYKK